MANVVQRVQGVVNRVGARDTSWRGTEPAIGRSGHALYTPTTDADVSLLYQWGPIQFRVWPLNVHEYDHETSSDWAHKEIAGAAIYREWVGENDETIYFRGKLFPYRVGGMGELEAFEALRRAGIANLLMRGDGQYMGWFVCEKLVRAHTFLSSEGVGQQVTFEAILSRVPVPENDAYMSELWGTVVPGR